ncbi:MAG: M23 family metallopeptidase [Deltaproteobacteria bacterium]|jgi:murein DD-endopeptidase MepM/ murein hydrolase activator NlpD|nr:M23 family metallopeptidase [Deltaproteobacteria bacterium]
MRRTERLQNTKKPAVFLVVGFLLYSSFVQETAKDPVVKQFDRGPAADSQATILRTGDGNAKVTFTPVSRGDKVEIYNRAGKSIASINWTGAFEVNVSEKSIREATTDSGIDLHRLLKEVGTVESTTGSLMVTASLPMRVQGYDGNEISEGTPVYFGLERLATDGAMAPVGAWGGDNMGPGGAVNQFNDRLIDRGVRGVKPRKPKALPKLEQTPIPPKGPHGEGVTPKDSSVVDGQWTDRSSGFLSSPTCTMRSEDSFRTTSEFGSRRRFRTKNGAIASKHHHGIDVAGKSGAPVLAAASGCVKIREIRMNRKSGYGLSIELSHPNGISTQYSHMHGFSKDLRDFIRTAKRNDEFCVKRGEQLGTVGQTGNCTGPHLHFGVKENGKPTDPRKHLRAQSNGDFSKNCQTLIAENGPLHALDDQAYANAAARMTGGQQLSQAHTGQ